MFSAHRSSPLNLFNLMLVLGKTNKPHVLFFSIPSRVLEGFPHTQHQLSDMVYLNMVDPQAEAQIPRLPTPPRYHSKAPAILCF